SGPEFNALTLTECDLERRYLASLPVKDRQNLFSRNRVRRSALTLAREYEALVALLGDLGASPAVAADALGAEIRQEAPRLALDVSAHIPGIRARHQRCAHDLCDMGAPCVLCLRSRFDGRKLVSSHVGNALGDPFHMLLNRHRHVGKYRWTLRTSDHAHVWLACHSQAEVSLRPVLPFLRQCSAAA